MLKGKPLLAYTAGIIDGEGCIGIYHRKQRSVKSGFAYVLIVAVWNTNPWLVQWLKMSYGGNILRPKISREAHPTWKQPWRWTIYDKHAAEFLELVLPYLQLKRPQAEIAITFLTKKNERPKTEAQIVLLEAELIRISKMNTKGKGPESESV